MSSARIALRISVIVMVLIPLACAPDLGNGDDGGGDGAGDRVLRDGGSTGDGGWSGADDAGGSGETCDEVDLVVRQVTPNVLIVLDRSASMSLGGHWEPVRDAIVDVAESMDTAVRLGLMVFPNIEAPQACEGLGMENRCEPAHGPTVECALGNSAAIGGELETMETCGATPASETLAAARLYLEGLSLDSSDPSVVLLATDGGPTCNDGLDGSTCQCVSPVGGCGLDPRNCLDDQRTYEVIDQLRGVGIRSFVIGVSATEYQSVLNEMALRGGSEAALMANDPESVLSAFQAVIGSVASCEFDLGDVDPSADQELVNIYVDGTHVPMDTDGACDEGWRWADLEHHRVMFCGTSCDVVRGGQGVGIRATFGCPTLI